MEKEEYKMLDNLKEIVVCLNVLDIKNNKKHQIDITMFELLFESEEVQKLDFYNGETGSYKILRMATFNNKDNVMEKLKNDKRFKEMFEY